MESKNFTYKYLKFVSFSGLELWDTKRYIVNKVLPIKNAIYLKEILYPFKERVFKEEMIKNNWQIIAKINFSGNLFLRDFEEIHIYKGNLNLVPENAIIYSKINVRHGCIYYNKIGNVPFGVSSEYPVYLFNENIVNGEFIHKLLRTEIFKDILNTKTTGISKARVKQDEFLNIQIPLPSLEEQNRLVENYANKIKVAEEQEQEAGQLEHEIENYLLEELGVEKQMEKKKQPGKLIFVHFKDIKEWGIDKISNRTFNLFNSHYEIVSLSNSSNLYIDVFRGKSPKYSENSTKYILNQKCNRWNSIEIEHARKVDDSWINSVKDIFLTKEHDILINSTGEGTIGRASYINKNFSGLLYDSHILLLRLNNKLIDSLYFIYFFNSLLGQEQVNEIKSAQSTKQTELGINNLLKINFPLPPLEKQKEIVAYITNLKNKIKKLHILAKKNREEAIQEFEQEIFYS